jgi:hypothetical protein
MDKQKDILVQVDLHCKWEKSPPMYRLYVNDELFSERNYIWQAGEYIRENLVMNAPSGSYRIRIETPSNFNFKLRNLRCTHGEAQIINNEVFKI